jgi:site-specific recombinase XerD
VRLPRRLGRFLAFVAKPLRQVTLGDVQAFAEELATPATPAGGEEHPARKGLAPASQARALAAIRSSLAFGHRPGYLPFDVGGAVRLPKLRQTLAERILSEADVHRLLALEPSPPNRVLLRLTYASGLRVAELVALRWRDLQPRGPAGRTTAR